MIFLTHLLGGILAAVYLGPYLSVQSGSGKVVFLAVAALFSLLPDLDIVKSKAGKHLQPFSTILSFVFRHRGFLHSFIFAVVVYFAMRYAFSANIAAAATIGYSSHLLLDAMTKEGIMPLFPLSRLRLRGFIRTGGFLEKIITAAVVILLLLRL